jgi:hypothetical protein
VTDDELGEASPREKDHAREVFREEGRELMYVLDGPEMGCRGAGATGDESVRRRALRLGRVWRMSTSRMLASCMSWKNGQSSPHTRVCDYTV